MIICVSLITYRNIRRLLWVCVERYLLRFMYCSSENSDVSNNTISFIFLLWNFRAFTKLRQFGLDEILDLKKILAGLYQQDHLLYILISDPHLHVHLIFNVCVWCKFIWCGAMMSILGFTYFTPVSRSVSIIRVWITISFVLGRIPWSVRSQELTQG